MSLMKRLSIVVAGLLLSACSSSPEKGASQAKALVEEGREAAQRGDHAGAVTLYSRAIDADPQSAEAWYSRGYSNIQLRLSPGTTDYARAYEDRAIADYSRAIELNPGYGDAYYNRAMLYSSRAMYRKAAEDLLSAVQFKNADPEPHLDLAHLYEQKFEDMAPQAYDHYEKYVDLGGRDREAREKARIAKERKRLMESIPKLPTAEDETRAQDLHGKAMELLKEGKKDEALKLVEELVSVYGRTRYVQDPQRLVGLRAMLEAYKKAPPK